MIIFESVTSKNFFSYGNTETEINLIKSNTCLVTGQNGAGKSVFLIDTICFALFNKTYRNVNKPTVVNTVNGKNCLVTCVFTIGTNRYIVKRGIKPNLFEIYKNDELINQDAATRDYQTYLEKTILQLNFKTFTQICILSSSNFTPFMQLSAAIKREVVEELLDLNVFSNMRQIAKEKTSLLVGNISNIENNIVLLKSKITTIGNYIEKIKNEEQNKDKEIEHNIAALDKEILVLETQVKDYADQKLVLYDTITDAADISNKKTKIISAVAKLEQTRQNYVTERGFFVKNDSCPTCKQNITSEFRSTKMDELDEHITKRDSALLVANDAIAGYDNRLLEITDVIKQVKSLDNTIASLSSSIKEMTWKINQYNLEKSKKIISLDSEHREVSMLSDELLRRNEEKDNLKEEKGYYDVANLLLKDTGIKSSIIKNYVPLLNKLINHYLHITGLFVKFEFDENFNETIRIRHRDELSYYNLSEGEKRRVDLAILFAFRKVAETKNICNMNLLIFDEILDSSLDAEGMESVSGILESFSDRNVFVISHREVIKDLFDRTIYVKKINNFSVVVDKSS